MKILLCGASGFVGRHIRLALLAQGHSVIGAGSHLSESNQIEINYARETCPNCWLPRVQDVDVVINAVGILRSSARSPMDLIHTQAPCALFDAVQQASKQDGRRRRIIQISALGVEGATTQYALSKRAADEHLLRLLGDGAIDGTVLRPSIVFGRSGASSAMFMSLSKLPVLLLPQPVLNAQVQPITVQNLARGVAALVARPQLEPIYECVGPTALSLAGFIAALRQQQGYAAAKVLKLPNWITQLSARVGDQIPRLPWCSATLAMLAKDNVASHNHHTLTEVLAGRFTPLNCFWKESWCSNQCD